jgi:hypothetical protein
VSAEPGTPALPEGLSHLLIADDVLSPGWIGSIQVAVCGTVVTEPSGGTDDPRYRLRCVAEALRWSVTR